MQSVSRAAARRAARTAARRHRRASRDATRRLPYSIGGRGHSIENSHAALAAEASGGGTRVATAVGTARRRRVALAELFAAPYDGLTPALVAGAPAASAFFAVKDAVKRGTAEMALGKTETTLLTVVCANVFYWGVKNPSEVLFTPQ